MAAFELFLALLILLLLAYLLGAIVWPEKF